MQKEDKVKHSFSIITTFSVISLYLVIKHVGFPLESVGASFLLSFIFFLYVCWFVFETHMLDNVSIKEAAMHNLKTNAAVWGIGIFYLVFGFLLIHAYV